MKTAGKYLVAACSIVLCSVVWLLSSMGNGAEISLLMEGGRRFPDAIIAGQSKCGTSMLRDMLRKHTQVLMLPGEVHFYDRQFEKGREWYMSVMPRLPKDDRKTVVMEKTPAYFRIQRAPREILKTNPATKVILIFRDPIERLRSHFQVVRHNYTYMRMGNRIFDSSGEINTASDLYQHGLYSNYLKWWLRDIPSSQLLVLDGDAFILRPWETMAKVQEFLGIEDEFHQSSFLADVQPGGTFYCFRGKLGHSFKCGGPKRGRKHREFNATQMQKLRDFFAPYDRELESLLGRRFLWMDRAANVS